MDRKRPILLIVGDGVDSRHVKAVTTAIRDVSALAGADLPAYELSDLKTQELLPKEYRHTHGSSRWFIENALNSKDEARTGYINADAVLTLFEVSVWTKVFNPYYLLLTRKSIYARGYIGIVGWYRELLGATLSTAPFALLPEPLRSECIETLAIHNLGHIFGLVPENRTEGVAEHYGLHCTNYCSMRHYGDWTGITNDRKLLGPFCKQCSADLQSFFAKE